MPYEASMQAFEPGAKLLVVTKGVTLSMRGKEKFGAERVREVLAGSTHESAEKTCHAVLKAAFDFQKQPWSPLKRKPEIEDMTALAMIRKK
jgi:serine phosphatase RsbU (regulator of sigma subunit)